MGLIYICIGLLGFLKFLVFFKLFNFSGFLSCLGSCVWRLDYMILFLLWGY